MPTRRPNVRRIIELEMKEKEVKDEDLIPRTEEDRRREEPLDTDMFIRERPKSLRYFLLKTSGGFECGRKTEEKRPIMHPCSHSWSSGQTWCIVDLKEKTILKPYRQRCNKHDSCNSSEGDDSYDERSHEDSEKYEAIPLYGKITVRKLAEWAVKQHLINAGKIEDDFKPRRGHRRTPAHCQALCDACKKLSRRCC